MICYKSSRDSAVGTQIRTPKAYLTGDMPRSVDGVVVSDVGAVMRRTPGNKNQFRLKYFSSDDRPLEGGPLLLQLIGLPTDDSHPEDDSNHIYHFYGLCGSFQVHLAGS